MISITGNTSRYIVGPRSGFTLIELLVVISIIMLLAGLTIGAASALRARSHVSATRAILDNLANSIEEFRAEYGHYPPDVDEDDDFGFNLPYDENDDHYGIKNLRVLLAGNYRCGECGYIYDKYHESGADGFPFAFAERSDEDIEDLNPCDLGKDAFSRMPGFLDWLDEGQVGTGILPNYRIEGREFYRELPAGLRPATDAAGRVTWDIHGAIIDIWGIPIKYDSLFDEDEPAAAQAQYPERLWGNKYFRMSARNWVIYSYGPD